MVSREEKDPWVDNGHFFFTIPFTLLASNIICKNVYFINTVALDYNVMKGAEHFLLL